jgi:hypothetical protein
MDENKTLETVRKLLAKAERTDNEAEATAYNEKAAALIAKYGLDAALASLAPDQPRPTVGNRKVNIPGSYGVDKAGLLNGVAKALRVEAIMIQQTKGRKKDRMVVVHLFGFEADLDRVELLFTSLLVQASFGLAASAPAYGESPAAYNRSWLAGFRSTVSARLRAAEARAQADAQTDSGPSVALVLHDRTKEVAVAVNEAYPRVTTSSRKLSGSGGAAGRAAGERADLGQTRVGNTSGRRAIG